MAKEQLVLIFQNKGKILRHEWLIKKGLRGIRDAKKVLKLQKEWGDPIEIIGEGSVAKLLRKEYKIYSKDPYEYKGVSNIDILRLGAEVSGLPVKKIQKYTHKMLGKVRNIEQ